MSLFSKIIFPTLVFLLAVSNTTTSRAEENLSENQQKVIHSMAKNCPENWTDKRCQRAVVSISTQTSAIYMKHLIETQNGRYAIPVNTVCQKNPSLDKQDYPIELMIKKHESCLSIIDKTMKETGTPYPDPKSFQLFKNALSCIKKESNCTAFEKELSAYIE